MSKDYFLNCGNPDDLGHHLLNKLKQQVRLLNECANQMRREKNRNYMLDEVIRRAKEKNPEALTTIRTGLLEWRNQRVFINEKKFFEMYSRTDSGKYAKFESEQSGKGTFGKLEFR